MLTTFAEHAGPVFGTRAPVRQVRGVPWSSLGWLSCCVPPAPSPPAIPASPHAFAPFRFCAFPCLCSPSQILELLMTAISAILPLSVFFTLPFHRLSHSVCRVSVSEEPWPRLCGWDVPEPGLEHGQREPQEQLSAGARESEGSKSLSNSISINIFQIKCRLSCKKVSATELVLQLCYHTNVLLFLPTLFSIVAL